MKGEIVVGLTNKESFVVCRTNKDEVAILVFVGGGLIVQQP